MTEQGESELSLPASAIVGQFNKDVQGLIKTSVGDAVRRSSVSWHVVAVIAAIAVAAAISYLMLNYAPRSHAIDVTYRHGADTERCIRDPDASSDHPLFVCVTVLNR